mmetsp:Transcript_125833/g.352342  ORF Transcript_125833/g.352342 Transcript_125833/m.352342 type:complete len:200 (+) Transcript_125833:436-1035(+)
MAGRVAAVNPIQRPCLLVNSKADRRVQTLVDDDLNRGAIRTHPEDAVHDDVGEEYIPEPGVHRDAERSVHLWNVVVVGSGDDHLLAAIGVHPLDGAVVGGGGGQHQLPAGGRDALPAVTSRRQHIEDVAGADGRALHAARHARPEDRPAPSDRRVDRDALGGGCGDKRLHGRAVHVGPLDPVRAALGPIHLARYAIDGD